MVPNSVGSWPYPLFLAHMCGDKHSSLLCRTVSDEDKMFYEIVTRGWTTEGVACRGPNFPLETKKKVTEKNLRYLGPYYKTFMTIFNPFIE